ALLGFQFAFEFQQSLSSRQGTGAVDPRGAPRQLALRTAEPITLERAGTVWQMYPRAEYRLAARVLHSQAYEDWLAPFVPVDLALGWGEMSDPAVDRWVEWRQADRWYYYRWPADAPVSREAISQASANVHVIPASDSLAVVLRQLERNDVVLLEGKLVDVEADRQGEKVRFQTSLTRLDTADSSCEIFYVERLVVKGEEFN
ncbi:MAG: hypothetical protein KC425_16940, partial [Anaerolineales bacterium]|nr:hypothetical protein [Anaerolineales bacterium]